MLQIPTGVSNRHLHISQEHLNVLLGENYDLNLFRELKQPGQYASTAKVNLVGPRGTTEGVRVLGPTRKQTQIEISRTDAIKLGLQPPVRDSGNLAGSVGVTIVGENGQVELSEGVIIAHRHIHITPDLARPHGLVDKQTVSVECEGDRGLIFNNVLVRVSESFDLEFHVDSDEANAAMLNNGDLVTLVS